MNIAMGRHAPAWRRIATRVLDRVTLRRTVHTRFGAYKAVVSPRAHLQVLSPFGVRVDSVHQAFLSRYAKPESTVWDIGANLGLFAFPAALLVKEVFAFEPDADMMRMLIRSVRLNPTLNVSPVPCALSDTDGVSTLLISRYGRSMNKLKGEGRWHDELYSAKEERRVPTLTIDTAARSMPAPSIIKIDAEGADYKVLVGGRETISRHRPTILIEVPKELCEPITAFLKEHRYRLFDAADSFREVEFAPWDTAAVAA
jgi:FkbM family methyltransferase